MEYFGETSLGCPSWAPKLPFSSGIFLYVGLRCIMEAEEFAQNTQVEVGEGQGSVLLRLSAG
jgi:hypothetical protein